MSPSEVGAPQEISKLSSDPLLLAVSEVSVCVLWLVCSLSPRLSLALVCAALSPGARLCELHHHFPLPAGSWAILAKEDTAKQGRRNERQGISFLLPPWLQLALDGSRALCKAWCPPRPGGVMAPVTAGLWVPPHPAVPLPCPHPWKQPLLCRFCFLLRP